MEAYSLAEVERWAAGLVPERYVEAMNEGGETFIVAAAAGDLVGFCSFKDYEVRGLYVAPSAARRGVGSTMLRQAEAAIAAVGHRAVSASAPPSRARRSMSATGYRVVERRDWRTRGGLVIPVVDMEKMLSP